MPLLKGTMKTTDVDFYERVKSQLQQLHFEVGLLSKGKPDNPINKFKLTFINEKLAEANSFLLGQFKPFKEFSLFDSEGLPSNSDAVIVLSQYLDCLEAWRCAHVHVTEGSWKWKVEDGTKIRAEAPTRYRHI